MSIHPSWQEPFLSNSLPLEPRIECPVPIDVIRRLSTLPEFVRAYEPGGMVPAEFIAFGVTQRTLGQFSESGWKAMESLR